MKFPVNLLLTLLIPVSLFAQEKTLSETFDQAKKKGKQVLVVIKVPLPSSISQNIEGLKDAEARKMLKENFVLFEVPFGSTEARNLIRKYPIINKYPAFVFLRPTGELLHYGFGSFNNKARYSKMIDSALAAISQKSLSDLEQEYLVNKNDIKALTALIDQRKKNGVTNNADLIEEYVGLLKISDFKDYATVRYILEAGPYLDGNAYKLARLNQKLVDSIYKTEPLAKRTAMNNSIINNTMAQAIKMKSQSKAYLVANFTASTWSRDYQKGARASNWELMRYYKAVKDTTQYFRVATSYYDNYYMKISADSIQKLEAKSRADGLQKLSSSGGNQSKAPISKEKLDSLIKSGRITQTTSSFLTTSSALSYANELNNAAYYFYGTGTKNPTHLTKALIWAKRAIELKPIWGYYDTLAHIYYALGIFNEALATQKMAIEMLKQTNRQPEEISRLQKEYDKMKNRTL